LPTATEQDLITQTARDYFEGWFDGDAVRMERALHPAPAKRGREQIYHEYLHLVRTTEGWKIVNALWAPA
jgi:Putative lumazine-binding